MEDQYKQLEFGEDGTVVYSVQECCAVANEAIGRLGKLHVRGEINDCKIVRGNMAFFDLKDIEGEYVVRCSMFGWQFTKFEHLLENGMEVVVIGKLSVYKNGGLSLVAEEIKPYGEGAWKKAFEELKKRLAGKGYFDVARKREIPSYVQHIGLITSEEGQGLHDFRKNLSRHGFSVLLYGVWVEGDKAEASIVRAIQWFNKNRPYTDVLVLIRGGGGFENLKVFNSEHIADAIVSSRIPVITGIGHEQDESIADYVADKTLSTPTAVAVYLKTQREHLVRTVDTLQSHMEERMEYVYEHGARIIETHTDELVQAMERVFERNRFGIAQSAERLHRGLGRVFEGFARIQQRLVRVQYAYERELAAIHARVERASALLASLSPEHVLQRGYSIVFSEEGGVIKRAKDMRVGEKVFVRLQQGTLGARVEEIQ